jgi:alkylhydroperoxidase family enzyme
MFKMSHTLLISPRFADHRIWSDIPARISRLSEVLFYDQPDSDAFHALQQMVHDHLPVNRGGFDVVVGAENAARLAVDFSLTDAAHGLVLFQPELDGIPEEMTPVDFSGLEERTRLYAPLLAAVGETDDAEWRALVAEVVEHAIGSHLTPSDAALVQRVMSDHSARIRSEIQRAVMARDQGQEPELPAAPGQRWIDRLRQVNVPVSIVSTRAAFGAAEALAARAPHGEAVCAHGEAGFPWLEDRDTAVAVLAAMLDQGG